jgi:hypothetical protein
MLILRHSRNSGAAIILHPIAALPFPRFAEAA